MITRRERWTQEVWQQTHTRIPAASRFLNICPACLFQSCHAQHTQMSTHGAPHEWLWQLNIAPLAQKHMFLSTMLSTQTQKEWPPALFHFTSRHWLLFPLHCILLLSLSSPPLHFFCAPYFFLLSFFSCFLSLTLFFSHPLFSSFSTFSSFCCPPPALLISHCLTAAIFNFTRNIFPPNPISLSPIPLVPHLIPTWEIVIPFHLAAVHLLKTSGYF